MPRSSARLAFAGLFLCLLQYTISRENVNNLKEICCKLRFTAKFSKENSEKLRLAALFISFPKTQKGAFLGGERGDGDAAKEGRRRGEKTRRIKNRGTFGARNTRRGRLETGKAKKAGEYTAKKNASTSRGTGAPIRSRTGTAKKKRAQRKKTVREENRTEEERFSPRRRAGENRRTLSLGQYGLFA